MENVTLQWRSRPTEGSSSPVQIHLQIWEDEFVLDELPDDPSHLVPLHLHYRTCVDLLRHGEACWRTHTHIIKSMIASGKEYLLKATTNVCIGMG